MVCDVESVSCVLYHAFGCVCGMLYVQSIISVSCVAWVWYGFHFFCGNAVSCGLWGVLHCKSSIAFVWMLYLWLGAACDVCVLGDVCVIMACVWCGYCVL